MAEKQSIKRFIVRDPHGHIEQEDGFSVVGEVHVDIVPGYGEPYADSEYIAGILTITIHNIEGNGITDITTDSQEGDEAVNTVTIKTNDNPEGMTLSVRNGSRGNGIASISEVLSPDDGGTNTHTITDTDGNEHVFHTRNGRKGDKGEQGDSAVYNPEDPDAPDFEMANTTGQSTTKAMTQKAVTDSLEEMREEKREYSDSISLSSLTQRSLIITGDPEYMHEVSGPKYKSVLVNITPGRTYKVTANSTQTTQVAVLTTSAYTEGATPSYATGWTGSVWPAVGESLVFTAPNNASIVLIRTKSNNVDCTPAYFGEVKDIDIQNKEDVALLKEGSEILKGISHSQFAQRTVYISNGVWANGSGSTERTCKLLAIEPGKRYRLQPKANTAMAYAFLQDASCTVGETPNFATGTALYATDIDEIRDVIAPDDAHVLYIYWKTGSTLFTPRILSEVVTPIDFMEDALDAAEPDLILVTAVASWSNSKIDTSTGEIGASTDSYLKKFEVEPGKEYYATAYVGSTQTGYSVNYFDENMTYICSDTKFGPRADATSTYYKQIKIDVPTSAKYVFIRGRMHYVTNPWPPQLFELRKGKRDVTPHTIEYHTLKVKDTVLPSTLTSSEAISDDYIDAGWAVMWPTSYTKKGTPTQVLAMLHGADGYVSSSVMGYSNSNWRTWRSQYLSQGYAILDINGINEIDGVPHGESTGDDFASKHYAGPRVVDLLNKAFEYLRLHYNVADKMLIHGTSMGGGLAMTFSKQFPDKVAAVGVFAPIVLMRSASSFASAGADPAVVAAPARISTAFGYPTAQDMLDDNYANLTGYAPLARCLCIEDGVVKEVDWSTFGSMDDAHNNNYDFKFIDHFPVPIRCWQGTADSTVPMWAQKIVFEAFQRGGSNASIRYCTGADHDDVGGLDDGSGSYIKAEAFAFFDRYRSNRD